MRVYYAEDALYILALSSVFSHTPTYFQLLKAMASELESTALLKEPGYLPEYHFLRAKYLVTEALQLTPLELVMRLSHPCHHWERAWIFFQNSLSCPPARLTGKRFFWKNSFALNPSTLDPRPESEGIVQWVLEEVARGSLQKTSSLLDLGTGTGCLCISLLLELPQWTGTGVDSSQEALTMAKKNAEDLGVASRVTWMKSHWWQQVVGKFHCIVSNPPYIPNNTSLPPEVSQWDPPLALFGGETGMCAYEEIIPLLPVFLHPLGQVIFEVGDAIQGDRVKALLEKSGLVEVEVRKDLAGKIRYVTAMNPSF